MSAVRLMPDAPPIEEPIIVPRRQFKTSDLPLTPVQRSSIDSLLHTIKKKGEFDALRKTVWSQYADSQAKTAFIASLTDLAESEIDREPLLLSRDRGKAATLIQGAVDRGDIYKSVEANIDALIAEHIIHVEQAAREIRRHEVGGDVAAEEERLGNKTEEEYTKEATVRRQAREKVRKQDEARKRREEEKERLRAEEKMKMLELEKLRTADERRRDHEAREEKRKREREAQRAVEKQLEEERELQRRERYEMRKKEEKEREREREWEWEREREQEMERERDSDRHRGRDRSRDYAGSSYRDLEDIPWGGDESVRRSRSRPQEQEMTPLLAPEVDEKALEEAALELLLKEGRELAAKSGPRTELERSESLEPPPRKSQLSKSKLSEPSTPKPTTDDRKSTPKPETRISSKTSYSNVTRQPAPTPADLTDLTPHHRSDRSASSAHDPYSRPRHPSRSRSRSRTRYSSRWDSEKRKADAEAKQAWKEQAVRQREREAEAWKRAAREGRDFTESPEPNAETGPPSAALLLETSSFRSLVRGYAYVFELMSDARTGASRSTSTPSIPEAGHLSQTSQPSLRSRNSLVLYLHRGTVAYVLLFVGWDAAHDGAG
ncbi:MAG: hypothetical protein LQ347_004852 [Umbilicaria vellea]|nr:MAG: hypothetical protein LQ347_004852 [Umbilicaria vellea]